MEKDSNRHLLCPEDFQMAENIPKKLLVVSQLLIRIENLTVLWYEDESKCYAEAERAALFVSDIKIVSVPQEAPSQRWLFLGYL